jgi:hypothetical protein
MYVLIHIKAYNNNNNVILYVSLYGHKNYSLIPDQEKIKIKNTWGERRED